MDGSLAAGRPWAVLQHLSDGLSMALVQSLSRFCLFATPWTADARPPCPLFSVLCGYRPLALSALVQGWRQLSGCIYLFPTTSGPLSEPSNPCWDPEGCPPLTASLLHNHSLVQASCVCVCVCTQSCLTFCDSMSYSPPGPSVHGISQARILTFPSPGGLPDPGIKAASLECPVLAAGGFTTVPLAPL